MIERFFKQLEKLVGAPANCHYLLAVSGGADSIVMADLFRQAGLSCTLAHCNFHLRGEESNRDMEHVQRLAKTWNWPLFIKEFDTPTLQKGSGLSIEMVARKLRYDWFEEIGQDFDYIVTAHQADDAAETLLLNLCRGTGLKGLVSIPEKNGKIIRPLLCFSAKEIRDYAKENNIPFVVDSTNTDETIKRNKIRGSILPLLKELNPNLLETLSRNREIFQLQYNFYQKSLEQVKQKVVQIQEDCVSLSIKELMKHSDHQLLLYEILKDFNFNASTIQALCENPKTGTTFHSNTHILIVNRDEYLIKTNQKNENDVLVFNTLGELQQYFEVEKCIQNQPVVFPKNCDTLYIPAEKLTFPITLRHWKHGDFFYPLGGKGKQKLSDFFNDHKVDGFTKQKIFLLCIGTNIAWIIGYRTDERYKLKHSDKNYYKIKLNER